MSSSVLPLENEAVVNGEIAKPIGAGPPDAEVSVGLNVVLLPSRSMRKPFHATPVLLVMVLLSMTMCWTVEAAVCVNEIGIVGNNPLPPGPCVNVAVLVMKMLLLENPTSEMV